MYKIYEISLTPSLRFMLFQSGALSFQQFFTQKSFSLSKNEIQSLIERNDQTYILWFERNNLFHALRLNKEDHGPLFAENKSLIAPGDKVPWKIFKHTLAPIVCMFAAFIPAFFFSSFLYPKNLKPFFISETCYAPCAKIMSELTYAVTLPYSILLLIPLFYLIGSFLAVKLFKFKMNRPVILALFFLMATIPFMSETYNMFNKPSVRSTLSHWKKGTLNLETISQIKQEFRKDFEVKRKAASSSSNHEE